MSLRLVGLSALGHARSALSVLVVPVSDSPEPMGMRRTAAAANMTGAAKCSCDCSGIPGKCFCRVLCVGSLMYAFTFLWTQQRQVSHDALMH